MLPALLLSYHSRIPPRAIRTPTGRGSNRPRLLSATPPCVTSFLVGRHPYQPTSCRVFLRTSAPPSRRFRSLLTKAVYTQPTTASSCSSVNRLRNPLLTRSARRDARLVLLNDEPVRIYLPLPMRPSVMQACHSTASCHLGSTRTLRMIERFCWWIGMNVCTRW